MGENPLWHAKRLLGIGGSEIGSLLRHHFGMLHAAPGSSFNGAGSVVLSKLLRQFPYSTDQAARGTELEPLARAVFERRFRGQIERDEEAFEVTNEHKSKAYMRGNIDDAFILNSKRLLVDYKTSTSEYVEVNFDHVAQLHQYQSIAESNSRGFDRGVIVGLHAPEEMFHGLRDVVSKKDANPALFDKWVDIISEGSIRGLSLKVYPVEFKPELCRMCEYVADHYWNDFILAGKPLPGSIKSAMDDEREARVGELLQDASSVIAAIKSGNKLLGNIESQIKMLVTDRPLNSVKWPNSPTTVSTRSSFDIDAAVAAAEANGIEQQKYASPSEEVDVDGLMKAYASLGGDPAEFQKKIYTPNNAALKKALKEADVDFETFLSYSISLKHTTKKAFADELASLNKEWDLRFNNSLTKEEFPPSLDEELLSEGNLSVMNL